MLVNDKEAIARLSSSGNLINLLKSLDNKNTRKSAMSLFIKPPSATQIEAKDLPKTFNPFDKPIEEAALPVVIRSAEIIKAESSETLDRIVENNEAQIKLGLAHDSALDLLTNSVTLLANKLDDVRADRLPGVISAASKVVESIRKERLEQAKSGKDREVHYHFYTPEQKSVSEYEVIDVASSPA